jgi:hypothetical protein
VARGGARERRRGAAGRGAEGGARGGGAGRGAGAAARGGGAWRGARGGGAGRGAGGACSRRLGGRFLRGIRRELRPFSALFTSRAREGGE